MTTASPISFKSASGKEQRAHHSQLRPYYDTPKYLKQLKERIHTSSKESVTSSNKQDADDNLGTSGAIPPNQLQKIRPGILTPVGQEGGASGQRLVPTSALPLARRAGKAQSVVPSRGCLRQPGALRDRVVLDSFFRTDSTLTHMTIQVTQLRLNSNPKFANLTQLRLNPKPKFTDLTQL